MCKERIEESLKKLAGTKESNLPLTGCVQRYKLVLCG